MATITCELHMTFDPVEAAVSPVIEAVSLALLRRVPDGARVVQREKPAGVVHAEYLPGGVLVVVQWNERTGRNDGSCWLCYEVEGVMGG